MVNFYEFRIAVNLIVTKYCPWPKNWNWLGHQQYLKGFLRVSEYYIHIWLLSTSGALTTIFVIWTTASEQSRHRSLADLEWPLEEDHATTTTTMLELIYYASYIWRRDFAIVLSFEYLNRPFCKQKIPRRILFEHYFKWLTVARSVVHYLALYYDFGRAIYRIIFCTNGKGPVLGTFTKFSQRKYMIFYKIYVNKI